MFSRFEVKTISGSGCGICKFPRKKKASDGKRHKNPNKKKYLNSQTSNVGVATAYPDNFKVEKKLFLSQLIFELEQFEPLIGL